MGIKAKTQITPGPKKKGVYKKAPLGDTKREMVFKKDRGAKRYVKRQRRSVLHPKW